MSEATDELEKLLAALDANSTQAVMAGDVARLARLVLKVADERDAAIIFTLSASVLTAIFQLGKNNEDALRVFAQHVKGYVDGKVEQVGQAVKEVKEETWN